MEIGTLREVMENKIFVAVGKELEERRSVLKWALKKFKGETICVFYVHVPSQMIPLPSNYYSFNGFSFTIMV